MIVLLDDAQNVETLQHTFVCLSFLFKFLTKYLVRDLADVFKYVVHTMMERMLMQRRQKIHAVVNSFARLACVSTSVLTCVYARFRAHVLSLLLPDSLLLLPDSLL